MKSLPKVGMEFQIRPSRSLSTISLKIPNTKVHRISSKALPTKQQDYVSPYQQSAKIEITQKKTEPTGKKTPRNPQPGIQVEHADNIASVRRKKLEELKLKSNKKKR